VERGIRHRYRRAHRQCIAFTISNDQSWVSNAYASERLQASHSSHADRLPHRSLDFLARLRLDSSGLVKDSLLTKKTEAIRVKRSCPNILASRNSESIEIIDQTGGCVSREGNGQNSLWALSIFEKPGDAPLHGANDLPVPAQPSRARANFRSPQCCERYGPIRHPRPFKHFPRITRFPKLLYVYRLYRNRALRSER
jgi:hypothetical protein